MRLAWEVADFAGGEPFALDQASALEADAAALDELGASRAFVELTREGVSFERGADRSRNVRMRLSPGRPLCEGCREPLAARLESSGVVVSCERCGSSETYRKPENSQGIRPFPRAALDGSLREGALDAAVEEAPGGVSAIRCPTCSAALVGVDGRGLARCRYCNTVSRIAPRLRAAAGALNEPSTKPYWILFEGPSPTRQKLASLEAKRVRKQEEEAGREQRSEEVRRVEQRDRAERRRKEAERGRAKAAAERREAERRKRRTWALDAVGMVGPIFLFSVYRALSSVTPQKREVIAAPSAPPGPADPAESFMSEVPPSEPPPARPPAVQTLPSFCGCPVPQEGGGERDLTWGVEIHSMVRFGADVTLSVDYSWLIGDERVAVLANDQTAPPNPIRSMTLELGVACDGDSMLVSDGRYLTRWSLAEHRVVGSVAMPSPFGPRAPGEGVSGECYRAELRGRTMTFEDGAGLAHRLRVPRELR
jgi:hypothetical protein